MFFEVFIVDVWVVASVMYASAFPSVLGGAGHQQTDGKHILAFPALRGVKDFIHHIALPETYNFSGFFKGFFFSGNPDISPHQCSQGISDIAGIEACSV